MKIVSFIIHAAMQAAPAFIGLAFMVLAFNGYTNGSDAAPGFIIYIILALLNVFGLGVVCAFVAQWLARRLEEKTAQANFWGPAISITAFAFVGWVMLVVSIFVAMSINDNIYEKKRQRRIKNSAVNSMQK